jgi:hypothetical protein
MRGIEYLPSHGRAAFKKGIGISQVNSQSSATKFSSIEVSNGRLRGLMVCSKNLESSIASILTDRVIHTSELAESITTGFARFTIVN